MVSSTGRPIRSPSLGGEFQALFAQLLYILCSSSLLFLHATHDQGVPAMVRDGVTLVS